MPYCVGSSCVLYWHLTAETCHTVWTHPVFSIGILQLRHAILCGLILCFLLASYSRDMPYCVGSSCVLYWHLTAETCHTVWTHPVFSTGILQLRHAILCGLILCSLLASYSRDMPYCVGSSCVLYIIKSST